MTGTGLPVAVFHCGQVVRFADNSIGGVIEQVIFCRNTTHPLYLVEYWHAGIIHSVRLHEAEIWAEKGMGE